MLSPLLAAAVALLTTTANAQDSFNPPAGSTWPTNLVGTWSTKSNKTLTGPGFFNPIKDELIEPSRTGISYSFTNDGWYEEAYYRAISNPAEPACPGGIMQWQHGRFYMDANGSLILQPIAVDGRQLLSEPCTYDNGIYTRYNQSELFLRYEQYTDLYHNIPRLDLYQFNGAPMNPMYLVYSPPEMLPTSTLNPTTATATPTSSKFKRDVPPEVVPINWKKGPKGATVVTHINADRLWWIGLGMTGLGGLLYMGPRRMGIQI